MKELIIERPERKTRDQDTEITTIQLKDVNTDIGGKHGGGRGSIVVFDWIAPEILDHRGEPMQFVERCEAILWPTTNFWKRVIALEGRELSSEEAAKFNVGSLIGKTCQARVSRRETAKGRLKLVIVETMKSVSE